MARSLKENERRLAIHPLHVERIAADLRERVYLEHGYGERFGVPDEHLAARVAGLRTSSGRAIPEQQPPRRGREVQADAVHHACAVGE
jgi:alanine dehydrogenase